MLIKQSKKLIDNLSMKIFFWDFQDDNDIIRQWLLFSLNLLVLAFTSIALYKTWRYYRRCMFQMMPLSINLAATFVLLMLKLFEKGYEFAQIGHYIEIFTYFLFCYTFAIMYTAISNPQQRVKVQKIWNVVLIAFSVVLLVLSVLVVSGVISKNCQKQDQQWPAIISLTIQFLSFVPTGYYGLKILRKMMKQQQEQDKTDKTNSQIIHQFTSEVYIKERKKQIIIVLGTYLMSLFIRIMLSIFTIFMWDDFFTCELIDNAYILTSDSASGQVVLVFAQINQLLPHIVIPIAMFVVPLRRMSRSKDVHLVQQLIDEDQQHDSHEQIVQNRVSSLLTSRLSDSPVRIGQKSNMSSTQDATI